MGSGSFQVQESFKGRMSTPQNSFSKSMKKAISFKNLSSSFKSATIVRTEPFLMVPNEIRDALEKLSVNKLNQFEFEEIFEEAMQYMRTCSIEHSDFHVLVTNNSNDGKSNPIETEHPCLPLPFLIAGSETFRQKLLKLETDTIFCNLMMSSLSSYISEREIRVLSRNGKEREISRLGHKIFSSKLADDKKQWSYIVSGKLKVSLDSSASLYSEDMENEFFELGPGEYFGGFGILESVSAYPHIIVETKEATKLLELSGDMLEDFVRENEHNGKRLMSRMGGTHTDDCTHFPQFVYF